MTVNYQVRHTQQIKKVAIPESKLLETSTQFSCLNIENENMTIAKLN